MKSQDEDFTSGKVSEILDAICFSTKFGNFQVKVDIIVKLSCFFWSVRFCMLLLFDIWDFLSKCISNGML